MRYKSPVSIAIITAVIFNMTARSETPQPNVVWSSSVARTGSTPFMVTDAFTLPGKYKALCYESRQKRYVVKDVLFSTIVAVGVIQWPPSQSYTSYTAKGNITLVLMPGSQAMLQIEPSPNKPYLFCEVTFSLN